MTSWVTNSEELLGVSEKQAEKFSREWYNITWQETSALWEQRHDIHKGDEISMSKLREQVAEAVQAKGARKGKTRRNQKYLKMSQNNSRTFWSKRRLKLEASISRFAIEAEASDEERAVLNRELAIETQKRSYEAQSKS